MSTKLYPVRLGDVHVSSDSWSQLQRILGERPDLSKADIVRLGITMALSYMSDKCANIAMLCKVCGTKVTLSDSNMDMVDARKRRSNVDS